VVWGNSWENSRVVVHCDNEAAVAVLNFGYAREPQTGIKLAFNPVSN